MIDYRLCGVILIVDFIIFLILLKRYPDVAGTPFWVSVSYCITVVVGVIGLVCMSGIFGDNPNNFVNPSITTTKYEVTQIKTNLETDRKTYVLTSKQGDKETLTGEYDNLSKGDVLLKKQYIAKKVQLWLVYRTGKFKMIEWFLVDD
ncbi:hypothetical protein SAMN04487839_12111 [Streptococcus gallolyticus]|uniref:Uncharacterized protein n=1 Tax=Streptococcus gallolyticus TaxID=315405 RepID=A0A1H9LFW7_9STRE|nr:hypothetical protein [Streptococcus gallolyticus]SEF25553.1 hypothetical protein SAMN02910295_0190 [Streptococcus gallolyticus]SEM38525.1 hypothetical protein SAMN04487839_12111 [Streptococcus gallolyticus]SER10097.1 hypothetical protein SAMN04487840_10176 [Streptococcus gallolyticus]